MSCENDDLFQRVRFRGRPVANPEAVVVCGRARFTVLTPRLIRMEWSETGEFEDRGTYAFPTRHAAVPPFVVRTEGERLTIDTGRMLLHYEVGTGRFRGENLSVVYSMDGVRQTWQPGCRDPWNLRGTRRTLDECEADASLEEGLLSRTGWALFDDSRSVLFDAAGWVTPRPDHLVQDWYLFAYGHDYRAALAEYTQFGGAIPLIPRFVLGTWWSRYWAYSDQDLKDLVSDFQAHDLPLDVLVVDIDWHTPHSWTGYTWNRELFPDPPAFLAWAHQKGLHTTLNLHPAQGVQPFEEAYPEFARAMGVDPDSGKAVAFRIADKEFVKNYFERLHHPLEDEGVDFWWVDWQQGVDSEIEGLDPLPWLNHLHFSDSVRRGKRPILYSRWGGLGNHRYPIGFSGDTYAGWPALQFQPHFTATAANVDFGWWSHDIGGHMGGATEPELYARWVQFGALSPCLRLHATKDVRAERRPWKFPQAVFRAVRAAFHWRYRLIPYIYTMARVAHDTGLSLCRPMYYEYPQEDAAYAARYQYFFGDQILAAPIVSPADPVTGMAATDVWVPEGTWIDCSTKERFSGPGWVRLVGDLDRVPMLVKAGAILPLAAPFDAPSAASLSSGTTAAIPRDRLVLAVFPESGGRFRLYEDDGVTQEYLDGHYEWTEIRTRQSDEGTWEVEIAPVEGSCAVLPSHRAYEIRLEGSRRPRAVYVEGEETSDWTYDAASLTVVIQVPPRDKRGPTRVSAVAEGCISALGEAHNGRQMLSDVRRLLSVGAGSVNQGPSLDPEGPTDPEALLEMALSASAPGQADAVARLGGPFVRFVEFVTPEEARRQLGRVIVGAPRRDDGPCDVDMTFTLFRSGQPEHHSVRIGDMTTSQIIDTPFAFDGQVETLYWEAAVRVGWRGRTLIHTYRSKLLFASVYAWRALFDHSQAQPHEPEALFEDDGSPEWQEWVQDPAGLRNLTQPYLFFWDADADRRAEGESLVDYFSTIIVSPDDREVMIRFASSGASTLYLNGQEVETAFVEQGEAFPFPGFWRRRFQTGVVRLCKGENSLSVHACSPAGSARYFGAAVLTPAGELWPDLVFR